MNQARRGSATPWLSAAAVGLVKPEEMEEGGRGKGEEGRGKGEVLSPYVALPQGPTSK